MDAQIIIQIQTHFGPRSNRNLGVFFASSLASSCAVASMCGVCLSMRCSCNTPPFLIRARPRVHCKRVPARKRKEGESILSLVKNNDCKC